MAIHANYGYSTPASPLITGGTFAVSSPASLGASPAALQGGFMSVGGSIFVPISPERNARGAGYVVQKLLMGFARGNADGFGLSIGKGISAGIQLGMSISIPRRRERGNPTPV